MAAILNFLYLRFLCTTIRIVATLNTFRSNPVQFNTFAQQKPTTSISLRIFILTLFLPFFSVVQAQTKATSEPPSQPNYPSDYDFQDNSLVNASASAYKLIQTSQNQQFKGQLVLKAIKQSLSKGNASTIEKVIGELPDFFRSNYTLVYKGQGLQQTDYAKPRVLMFTPSTDFAMTFNGDSAQRGGKTLEFMEYLNGEFRFREIVFSKTPLKTIFSSKEKTELFLQENNLKKNEVSSSNGALIFENALITSANPQKCAACHYRKDTESVVPIWAGYPFWPGVYGSIDDSLFKTPVGPNDIDYSNVPAKVNRQTPHTEYTQLKTFIEKAAGHPRYKHLKNINQVYERHSSQTVEDNAGHEGLSYLTTRSLSPLVNTRLTMGLYSLYAESLIRLWEKSALYRTHKWKILHGFFCDIESFKRIQNSKNLQSSILALSKNYPVDNFKQDEKPYELSLNVLKALGFPKFVDQLDFQFTLKNEFKGVGAPMQPELQNKFDTMSLRIPGWALAHALKTELQKASIVIDFENPYFVPYQSMDMKYYTEQNLVTRVMLSSLSERILSADSISFQNMICNQIKQKTN